MEAQIHYLPFDGEQAREIRHKVGYEDDYELSLDEFESHYEHIATDDGVTGDSPDEVLREVWGRWNRGSGEESSQFLALECADCEATFAGAGFESEASMHEDEFDHTVEGHRSISVADVVIVDGEAYVCAKFGWDRTPALDPEVASA